MKLKNTLHGCTCNFDNFIPSGEIDRCLKKVQEGVESFEDIWQKVNKIFFFHVLCIMVLYWLH